MRGWKIRVLKLIDSSAPPSQMHVLNEKEKNISSVLYYISNAMFSALTLSLASNSAQLKNFGVPCVVRVTVILT